MEHNRIGRKIWLMALLSTLSPFTNAFPVPGIITELDEFIFGLMQRPLRSVLVKRVGSDRNSLITIYAETV